MASRSASSSSSSGGQRSDGLLRRCQCAQAKALWSDEMSQTVTLSDALYARLAQTARQRGLQSIEQLIETWQAMDDELARSRAAVQRIDAVWERMAAKYGVQPDSTESPASLRRAARSRSSRPRMPACALRSPISSSACTASDPRLRPDPGICGANGSCEQHAWYNGVEYQRSGLSRTNVCLLPAAMYDVRQHTADCCATR